MSRPIKGRGTALNLEGRFETSAREALDDGWGILDEELPPRETQLLVEQAKTIITRNESPDIPFSQSINPYRGCEHGCVYCYARPAHAYVNLSPGLDFETRIFYKPDAARLLEQELRKPGYVPSMISLGANTDPYQPAERRLGLTRSILEVLARFRHPVGIVTKGAALIERDVDVLQDLARDGLVLVAISITTLRPDLKRTLEPRTSAPATRLRILKKLSEAGIPTMVMFAPVIPFVNDAEMEQVLEAASEAGARRASYVMLRLPYEVKDLFKDWLETHEPLKARHVLSLVEQVRGGKLNDSSFGKRFTGEGEYARLIRQRFDLACKRFGLNEGRYRSHETSKFRVPPQAGDQLALI